MHGRDVDAHRRRRPRGRRAGPDRGPRRTGGPPATRRRGRERVRTGRRPGQQCRLRPFRAVHGHVRRRGPAAHRGRSGRRDRTHPRPAARNGRAEARRGQLRDVHRRSHRRRGRSRLFGDQGGTRRVRRESARRDRWVGCQHQRRRFPVSSTPASSKRAAAPTSAPRRGRYPPMSWPPPWSAQWPATAPKRGCRGGLRIAPTVSRIGARRVSSGLRSASASPVRSRFEASAWPACRSSDALGLAQSECSPDLSTHSDRSTAISRESSSVQLALCQRRRDSPHQASLGYVARRVTTRSTHIARCAAPLGEIEPRSGTRCGSSRCPATAASAPQADTGGSTPARTDASRP